MQKLSNFMMPRWYLRVAGVFLILIGILGFVGVIGPTVDKSIFGTSWWFDNPENIAHVALGVIAILSGFILPAKAQRVLAYVFVALGFFFGVYSLFMAPFGPATLQAPGDTILNLVLGTWALWAAMNAAPQPKLEEVEKAK